MADTSPKPPYREPGDLQNQRDQYINAIDRAKSQYELRERILTVLMVSPIVLAAPTMIQGLIPWPSYLILAVPSMFMLVRAMDIRSQKKVLESLRKGVEGLSLEKQDEYPDTQENNERIIDSFAVNSNTIVLPTMITACVTLTCYLYSKLDPAANPNLVLSLGMVAAIAVVYNAVKMKNVQNELRGKLRQFLPYIDNSSKSPFTYVRVGEDVVVPAEDQLADIHANPDVVSVKNAK